MERKSFTQVFEELPLYAQIILIIFLGGPIGGIIRILTYLESKKTSTLIAGLVWVCVGNSLFVPNIIDLVSLITQKKIVVLND